MLTILNQLSRDWWHFAVRGVLAIVFGILAIAWPKSAITALVILFGVFALLDGILAVVTGIQVRKEFKYWWALLLEGLAGIAIGIMTFIWPNVTAFVLLYFIAAWAIVTGIFEIVAALEFRNVMPGEWATFLAGVLSILLGVLLFAYPKEGAVGMVWAIGFYAIAAGITEIIIAFRLRDLGQKLEPKQTSSTSRA